MVRVVAVGREDLLGCLKESIGRQSISLREGRQDLFAGGDDLVEESDICRWDTPSANMLRSHKESGTE
jgi:hypothetical protein